MFTPSRVTVLSVNKTRGTILLRVARADGVTETISADLPNNDSKIIAVWSKHEDRNHLLGYAVGNHLLGHAVGNHEDIAAYFEDEKGYGLEMNVVIAKKIPEGYAMKKRALQDLKESLESELEAINKKIDSKIFDNPE